jgi:hypothetical protein
MSNLSYFTSQTQNQRRKPSSIINNVAGAGLATAGGAGVGATLGSTLNYANMPKPLQRGLEKVAPKIPGSFGRNLTTDLAELAKKYKGRIPMSSDPGYLLTGATGALLGLGYWGYKKFKNRNRNNYGQTTTNDNGRNSG